MLVRLWTAHLAWPHLEARSRQRAKGLIKLAVREGNVEELSPQLKEYGVEKGLI